MVFNSYFYKTDSPAQSAEIIYMGVLPAPGFQFPAPAVEDRNCMLGVGMDNNLGRINFKSRQRIFACIVSYAGWIGLAISEIVN